MREKQICSWKYSRGDKIILQQRKGNTRKKRMATKGQRKFAKLEKRISKGQKKNLCFGRKGRTKYTKGGKG